MDWMKSFFAETGGDDLEDDGGSAGKNKEVPAKPALQSNKRKVDEKEPLDQPSAKKVSAKKVSPTKVSAKKVSPTKVSAKKVSPTKVSATKVSAKKQNENIDSLVLDSGEEAEEAAKDGNVEESVERYSMDKNRLSALLRHEPNEAKRAKLKEIELEVARYQKELEVSLEKQVNCYRWMLICREYDSSRAVGRGIGQEGDRLNDAGDDQRPKDNSESSGSAGGCGMVREGNLRLDVDAGDDPQPGQQSAQGAGQGIDLDVVGSQDNSDLPMLEHYDATTEVHIIKKWYGMVTSQEVPSIELLQDEARKFASMFDCFERAVNFNQSVMGLTRAECVAVTMFTDDSSEKAFYKTFNVACTKKRWKSYRVFSTLLTSAILKLGQVYPVHPNATLYRGLGSKLKPPSATRFLFKSFTSASLSFETARHFSGSSGTILAFQPEQSCRAARIENLSKYGENEIIILPFEVYDLLYVSGQTFFLKAAQVQEILGDCSEFSFHRGLPELFIMKPIKEKPFDGVVMVSESTHLPVTLQSSHDMINDFASISAPTGYSDVHQFQQAAIKGLKRACKAGSKAPLLMSVSHQQLPLAAKVTVHGILHRLYVPLEIGKANPDKASRVTELNQNSSNELAILTAVESGRVIFEGSYPEQSSEPADGTSLDHVDMQDLTASGSNLNANDLLQGSQSMQSRMKNLDLRLQCGISPGLRGLQNLGNTCFMNSVLQCLSKTRSLTDFCRGGRYMKEIDPERSPLHGEMIKAFGQLMEDMWKPEEAFNSSSADDSLRDFKHYAVKYARRFVGTRQHDAHEFLLALLGNLHDDLNRFREPYDHVDVSDEADTVGAAEMGRKSWDLYTEHENSVIVDIFTGQLRSSLTCKKCGNVSDTFEPFKVLPVPVVQQAGSHVDLYDCVKLFCQKETLTGSNKVYCDHCQSLNNFTKQMSIDRFPKVLVIQLMRFKDDEKLEDKVGFPLTGLDLSHFATISDGSTAMYDLYAVCCHYGSPEEGHYYAYAKYPSSSLWHKFNDTGVTDMVLKTMNFAEGYILFYELQVQN